MTNSTARHRLKNTNMVVENKALLERIVIMAGACHCAKNCNEILEAALKKGRLADESI